MSASHHAPRILYLSLQRPTGSHLLYAILTHTERTGCHNGCSVYAPKVFSRPNAGIVGSNSTRCTDVCPCDMLSHVQVAALRQGRSSIRGSLSTVYTVHSSRLLPMGHRPQQENAWARPHSAGQCRAIDIILPIAAQFSENTAVTLLLIHHSVTQRPPNNCGMRQIKPVATRERRWIGPYEHSQYHPILLVYVTEVLVVVSFSLKRVEKIAAGPRQHSHYWLRVPRYSGP